MLTKIVFLATIALACAKPSPSVVAAPLVAAPVVAPAPVVTATSSQYVARNYNGLVASAPLVSAPLVAPAPVVAAPYSVAAPYVASPYYNPYYASAPIIAV